MIFAHKAILGDWTEYHMDQIKGEFAWQIF
jgi:hypothetical protein